MATASAGLRWIDVLENQFDKSWVDLDLILNQLADEEDEIQITNICRKHAASLASCFAQLAHKSIVIFQNNAKLEAELLHLREEVSIHKHSLDKMKEEKDYLTLKLQSTLIQNHKLKFKSEEGIEEGDKKQNVEEKKSLSRSISREPSDTKQANLCLRLGGENYELRRELIDLESELIGARLDNVYLDKELAGRIQQIQLLASNTPAEMKERLWTQIEAEMCLQRAKTIAQICKTKQELRTKRAQEFPQIEKTKTIAKQSNGSAGNAENGTAVNVTKNGEREESMHAKGKQVLILKNPADDLGMAIIGGKEHNLPIIVSEVFPNSAIARSSKLNAGDILLSVNGEDFSKKGHQEAVNFLSSLRGQITFELQAGEKLSEDDPSNLDFRFYRIFEPAPDSPKPTTSKDIKPHPGRAVSYTEQNRVPNPLVGEGDLLPTVHSPLREHNPHRNLHNTVYSSLRDQNAAQSPRKDTEKSPMSDQNTVPSPRADPAISNVVNSSMDSQQIPGLGNLEIPKLETVVESQILLTAETPIVNL